LCSEARFTSTAGRLWEGREAAIAKVLQNAGGKLLAYYLTFGEDDFLLIADCPGQSRRHRRCRWRKHQQLENDGRGDLEGSLGCLQDCGRYGKGIQERRALTRFATALWADAARPAL
jgi:hypothetical protein